jgi:transcriptional regulator with XRE-family HTH domain
MIGISAQPISSAQIEEARKLLGWAKQKLAMESGLSLTTLKRLESGDGSIAAANQLIATLKAKGVELVPGGAKLIATTPKWFRPSTDERGTSVREAGVLRNVDRPGARMRKGGANERKG